MLPGPCASTAPKRAIEETAAMPPGKKPKPATGEEAPSQDIFIPETEHFCAPCKKSFTKRKSLLRHLRQSHGEKTHHCQNQGCDYASARPQNRDRHQSKCPRGHGAMNAVAFTSCALAGMGAQFDLEGDGLAMDVPIDIWSTELPSPSRFAAMFVGATGLWLFNCALCNAKFPATMGAAHEHALMHITQPEFFSLKCQRCNANFDFRGDLKMHRRSCNLLADRFQPARPSDKDESLKEEGRDMTMTYHTSSASTIGTDDWVGHAFTHDADAEQTQRKRERLWTATQRTEYFSMIHMMLTPRSFLDVVVTHEDILSSRGARTQKTSTQATSHSGNAVRSEPGFSTKAGSKVVGDVVELLQNLRLSPQVAAKRAIKPHRTTFNVRRGDKTGKTTA